MDFLKSAVASAIAKGPLASYSIADRVDVDDSTWTLNNATKRVGHKYGRRMSIPRLTMTKDDGSKCSVFTFDIPSNRKQLPLARNALRKCRTLRHPGVLKVIDTAEVRDIDVRAAGIY